jgi:hypothetical protein
MSFEKYALNGDIVVQKMIQKMVVENNIETVMETGTHIGHSTAFFGKLVKNVITIEINADWLSKAKNYLKDLINIRFFMGDSATVLKEELTKLNGEKVFLFLDAHFNNDLALDRELKAIAESKVIPYIMIHDFKVPNRKDLGFDTWDGKAYSLQNIEHMIKDIYPQGYNFYYNQESVSGQRGCIIIEPSKIIRRKVVYTAMFGQFDDVHDPIIELPGWDMLFFTDAKLKSNKWEIVNVSKKEEFDNIQMSRYYKILPHLHLKNYDTSLWVDASILICKPIDEFVNFITNDVKMGIYQHTKNWKTEFDVMNYWCRDMNVLNTQMSDYQKDGFDTNKTIMSGNVILREHVDDKVIQAMQLWWEQFNKYYIKRDQISLAYSIWKSNLSVNFFPGLFPRGDRNIYFRNFCHKTTNRIE